MNQTIYGDYVEKGIILPKHLALPVRNAKVPEAVRKKLEKLKKIIVCVELYFVGFSLNPLLP